MEINFQRRSEEGVRMGKEPPPQKKKKKKMKRETSSMKHNLAINLQESNHSRNIKTLQTTRGAENGLKP